jgi:hypothetical protein
MVARGVVYLDRTGKTVENVKKLGKLYDPFWKRGEDRVELPDHRREGFYRQPPGRSVAAERTVRKGLRPGP